MAYSACGASYPTFTSKNQLNLQYIAISVVNGFDKQRHQYRQAFVKLPH